MGHLGHGYFWLKLYKERSYKVGQLTIALYQYQDSVLLFKDHNCLYANMLFCLKSKSYALYISKLQNVIKISYNHHNMLFCNHFCIHT